MGRPPKVVIPMGEMVILMYIIQYDDLLELGYPIFRHTHVVELLGMTISCLNCFKEGSAFVTQDGLRTRMGLPSPLLHSLCGQKWQDHLH